MGKFQSRLEETTKNGLRPVPQPSLPQWCVIRVVQFTTSVINYVLTIIWVPTPMQGRAKAGFPSSCDIRRYMQSWIFLCSYCHIKEDLPSPHV